jgi:hypothetical protein
MVTVTVDEVQTAVGRTLTTEERAQAALWITDAPTIIRHGPDGTSNLDLASLDPDALNLVVRESVSNRIKRPDSATQVSVSVDDGQVSRTYESGTGQLEIQPWMWNMLLPAASGGAFTIRLDHARR